MIKVLIGLFLIFNISTFADECVYGLDKDTLKARWVAFKTPNRDWVNGSFKQMNVSVYEKASSFKELLEGSMAIINAQTVYTNNEDRDKTLFNSFFSFLNPLPVIKAHITDVDTKNKTFNLNVTMNGKSKVVPMQYVIDENDNFTSRGFIDVVKDFGLKGALDSLNKACFDLHKGVTWPDVEVHLEAKVGKFCKKSKEVK